MESPTDLRLPPSLPYPIKVVSIDAHPPATVQRGTRLLSYSFVYLPPTPDAQPETRFGTWDSSIEGTLDSWKLKVGDVVSKKKALDRPAVVIIEPCKHGMQIGGLCALCGKDMTNVDYTGLSEASRASIQMTHSAFGPTVSLEEAQRIERETAEHLLKSRKLSLIVDLDQTIVHATVDPTVGEWIAEGEAWEVRQAKKASSTPRDSDDSDVSSSDSDDECNPNWEALKDVKKFRLGPESFGPPSFRGAGKNKGKNKAVESEGCMYYIKPRPGWKEFLKQTATKYEMHVYTMGTRAYAEQVCAAIDPDGSIFGGRLLSRDESGSLTQKSLQRLFPCDTSMVVIIDDRADVWEWSPNLIKVIPYDFFVGIGDINSTFLPKIEPLTVSTIPKPPPGETPGATDPDSMETDDDSYIEKPPVDFDASPEAERALQESKAMLTQNNAALEAQLEERPLAKKQEELQVASTSGDASSSDEQGRTKTPETPVAEGSGENKDETKSPSPKPEKPHKKALLKNDDFELDRVGKLLNEVHSRFFSSYDARAPEHIKRKTGPSSRSYDVTRIIPRLRNEVLEGIHILFSSVIPLDTRPESTEIWKMAHTFGARCSTELNNEITHVVAAKRGTVKVDMARKRGGIKIVRVPWFTDSVALWKRQDETPYLLDEPALPGPSSSPTTDSQQISSDPDPDGDDWDEEPTEQEHTHTHIPGALELNAIDWNDINDEVEAAMNESDDDTDGGKSDRSGARSEDEWGDETNSVASNNSDNKPRLKRKRVRSVTPSDVNGSSDDALLRSPLAKRKKLAAERLLGDSRMKKAISADDLASLPIVAEAANGGSNNNNEMDDEDDGDDEEEEEEEEEDDFLARELEEEWG